MTMVEDKDKLANAKAQGQAQFDCIVEMVEELQKHQDRETNEQERAWEAAEQAILENALSVEVRGGWYDPSSQRTDTKPAEYRILLCTGGPAVRILGELSEYGEPETARLEVQDWFTPWTIFRPTDSKDNSALNIEEILLTYARCFYFGE